MKKILCLLFFLAGITMRGMCFVPGDAMSNAINAGSYSASGSYTDTKSNTAGSGFTNNYGQASNDVWYSFTVGAATNTVVVSLCGSSFDTYLHVLNSSGTEIASNDDNGPSCSGVQSSLSLSNLAPGTYYVDAEGYSSNTGTIVFSLNVSIVAPITISYAGPQTYNVGTAITSLTPTISSGTVSASGETATFAGTGSAGSVDGNGTSASFNQPLGATVDPLGNTFIAEAGSHIIRKITPAGQVSIFAGTYSQGFVNSTTGTSASFYHPVGLASDASGNIYVADEDNNVIRMITPGGAVSTFAGNGSQGINTGTVAAASATFKYPCGVAVDGSGNVYVADTYNNIIRKISGGAVSIFAGNVSGTAGTADGQGTAAGFNQPFSVVTDAAGNVYVTDRTSAKIRKITPSGMVSTLAGSGTAGYLDATGTTAQFNSPTGLAIDKAGNLYVADETNNVIRKVTSSGGVTTLSGTGAQGSANGAGTASTFNLPFGIAADAGGLVYVGDLTTNLIRKIVATPYTVSPALPAGLSLNNTTGVISGTPTAVTAQTAYAIKALNTVSTGSAQLTMKVNSAGGLNLSQDQNYIATYIPRVNALTTDALVISASSDKTSEQVAVQYFDGLGRPLQTVQVKGGAAGLKDIVQPVEYDAYGREVKKYLPYASPTVDGSYKASAITTEIGNFYYPGSTGTSGNQQTGNGIVINPNPYSVTNFELSPLNRVAEQGAPGTPWQLSAGHTQKIVYTANDQSSTFSATPGSGNLGSRIAALYKISSINADQSRALTVSGTYTAGQLYVTIAKNENWSAAADGCTNTTEEYKDKEGHVLIKRTYNLNAVTNKIEKLSTYYIYDDLGNLAFVLPPGANPDGGITSAANQTTLDNFCYQYRYDERNRLTQKRVPGKDWEYMVYNKLDQLVLSQDGVQRLTNQWTVTKYDALGRVIVTGLWNAGSVIALATLQGSIYGGTQWDIRNTGDTNTGYALSSYPTLSSYLAINYYDDYSFSNIISLPTVFNTAPANVGQTMGLPTASKANILGTANMLWNVNYYDNSGRNTQSYKQHYLGGGTPSSANYDKVVHTYNFNDQITTTNRQHYTNVSGSPVLAVTVADQFIYDHMGRKLKSWQTLTGTPRTLLSNVVYNELGQLWTKYLHTTDTVANNFKQRIDYAYNERGWLSTINNPATAPTPQTMFAMQLGYNSGSSPQYNGNIASQQWYTYQGSLQTFSYSYDKLNRLTSGVSAPMSETGIGYDLEGNIQTLKRDAAAAFAYTYITGTNQLQSVSGLTTGNYVYDKNGNMTTDARTGAALTYNLLNLPNTAIKTGTGAFNIAYTYDATGQKLRKVSGTTTTDYIGGIQYDNLTGTNGIDFIQTEEGRATRRTDNTYRYDYDLADNLGNTRVSFYTDPNTAITTLLQKDDYYPFGKRYATLGGPNHYLYNKKELQDETGDYDYGARFYDPVIARWSVPDPLADKYQALSPYSYVANNPILNVDAKGDSIIITSTSDNNINVRVTGKLVNESSAQFTTDQMNTFSTRLSNAIKEYYGSASDEDFHVTVTTEITVATKDNPLQAGDHAFKIKDDGKLPDTNQPSGFAPEGTLGVTPVGKNVVYLSTDVFNDDKPGKDGTGRSEYGMPTLERTGAHELGHSAGLSAKGHPKPGTMPGNLMHQSKSPNAGTKITKEQILNMKKSYEKGKLNQGDQGN